MFSFLRRVHQPNRAITYDLLDELTGQIHLKFTTYTTLLKCRPNELEAHFRELGIVVSSK